MRKYTYISNGVQKFSTFLCFNGLSRSSFPNENKVIIVALYMLADRQILLLKCIAATNKRQQTMVMYRATSVTNSVLTKLLCKQNKRKVNPY